jgi:hypothetical protein
MILGKQLLNKINQIFLDALFYNFERFNKRMIRFNSRLNNIPFP